MADEDDIDAGSDSRPPPSKPKSGGFKWKKDSHRDHDREGREERIHERYKPYNRGERSRISRNSGRDQDRDSSRLRDYDRIRQRSRSRSPRRDKERRSPSPRGNRLQDREPVRDLDTDSKLSKSRPKKSERKPVATPLVAAPAEQMIVVHVNDRLGTKSAIPCLPSDTIGLFKQQVAAMTGRKSHEIMLKRQGLRPFKDHITLADYEISDGVQIDLEMDTGD